MSLVAPTLQSFFTDRLARQLQASPQTICSYRDTLTLLLRFVNTRTGKQPSKLDWQDLDATMIASFLDDLEKTRGNGPRTRNLRLTAIRSLYKYAALKHPEHAAAIGQVLAIPPKRRQQRQIAFLTAAEGQALLNAPDLTRWEGRRDQAILAVMLHAGLRVSELTDLNINDIQLGDSPQLHCQGKGRKDRAVPLTVALRRLLAAWVTERGGTPHDPLFATRTGRRLSRDAIAQRVAVHGATAAARCPSLAAKKLHPHALRHSCAIGLLHAGVDSTVIALWLGHADVRSTQPYLHADLTIKEKALKLVTPADVKPGRYRPPDSTLAFLKAL